MGLAKYLGKSALSASQVLKDFNYEGFKQILLSQRICICFDKKAIASAEGFATIDMLVRLLSRLYPNLQLRCIDGRSPDLDYFNELAHSINEYIDLSISAPTAVIVVGDIQVKFPCLQFFAGSDQWLARFSMQRPQLCGDSINRFGAGAAACFAAANIFRHVFKDQLPGVELDNEFVYSTFNGCINEKAQQGPALGNINLNNTVLVGLGAIGNATAWALKDVNLSGSLHLVDGQKIDSSNLQRYVLATEADIDKQKTKLVDIFLNSAAVKSFPYHFDEYISVRGNWKIFRAAVCVDSAEDRRLVQGSLPNRIINAWTQQDQCGLSRHYNFLNDPCLACLYHPVREEKSLPIKIAESFGFTEVMQINMVRDYMAHQRPADIPMIQLIAHIKNIDAQALQPYIGKQLQVFYAEVICGGVMMQLTGSTQKQTAEVPSVFESAMSGILLAAEIIIDCSNIRSGKASTIHKLNLLKPITHYTYDMLDKTYAPDCICHDQIYRNSYAEKWIVGSKKSSKMEDHTQYEKGARTFEIEKTNERIAE